MADEVVSVAMELLLARHGLPVRRVTEDGSPLEELEQNDYPAWLEFVQRGYPQGVDVAHSRSGVVEALEDVIAANAGKRVAIVCHGGVINAWAAHVLGMEFRLFFDADSPQWAEWPPRRLESRPAPSRVPPGAERPDYSAGKDARMASARICTPSFESAWVKT